jgi:hypothetical protein
MIFFLRLEGIVLPYSTLMLNTMRHFLFGIFWLCTIYPLAAQSFSLSGQVRARVDQAVIEGARITDSLSLVFTRTDASGQFVIKLDTPFALLHVQAVGFQSQYLKVAIRSDTFLTIDLVPFTIASVEISDSISNVVIGKGGNLIEFPISRLERIPALLGEPDLFKSLTLLPGVSTGLEGTTGIQVRGGQPGQVLTLLDDAPVYSTSHLFGLVSAFQPEILRTASLYKGWAPGYYGGRITGALDLHTRSGDTTRANKASIGLISSRVYVQGQLGKQSTRYTLGGRLAYLNLFTLPINLAYRNGSTDGAFSYWLYDVHGSLTHQWKPGQTLRLSVYHSRDRWGVRDGAFRVDENIGLYSWGNAVASLRYDHLIGTKHRYWVQASGSGYDYAFRAEEQVQVASLDSLISNEIRYNNGLWDMQVKGAYQYDVSAAFRLETGLQVGGLWIQPGAQTVTGTSLAAPIRSDTSFWLGNHAMWLDAYAAYGRLTIDAGLRISAFQGVGRSFVQVEPRVALAWDIKGGYVLSGSYARHMQPLLWASPSQIGLPGDLWLPAGRALSPQLSEQVTVGLTKSYPQGSISLTGYYRESEEEILYQPSLIVIGELRYEQVLEELTTNGSGRAYGVELAAAFDHGPWSGWLGYTLAYSEVKFDASEWQPALFDQRHQVDITTSWNLSTRTSLSANWVLRTGRPIFVPEGRIRDLNGRTRFLFGDTPVRLPAYHRLDIGIKWATRRKSADWQVGVYNAYNRLNPLFLTFVGPRIFSSGQIITRVPAEVRAQGGIPFLPYVSYSWRF